ncbi:hypothetical protein [Burkholderia cenocepacia]|uniref:hypothetical protein n=1 Tax=Burkholderia cenocepacia TaxID=95486 RepID=UPI0011BD552E|nr:hypothetical protein [Burkholderia cenocepacia]MDN7542745.1 hypothetical protein [Burkholderia cenocepacia]QUN54587.1 hypothetical protein KEH58_17540 [Burkholderia cenocepacia]
MEKVDLVLRLLREDESTPWVADQVASSFAQGVSMNVKEALADVEFFSLEPQGLSSREKQKREKYETTRPYTDDEKLLLLAEALETVYVDLPAIQVAGLKGLQSFTAEGISIEFAPPDEPEQDRYGYTDDLKAALVRSEELRNRFDQFKQELMK